MSVESAYPGRLIAYAAGARASTIALTRAGNSLSTAIEAFLATDPDPQVISGVTDWGQELAGYASRKSQIDQWVHDVGVAFQNADSGNASRPAILSDSPIPVLPASTAGSNPFGPLPGGPAVTIPTAVAIQKVAQQQRVLQAEQDCTAPGALGPLGYQPFPEAGPEAEALPPGELQREQERAQAQSAAWSWLTGDGLPDDPHVPEGPDPWQEVETRTIGGPVPVQYPPSPDAAAGGE